MPEKDNAIPSAVRHLADVCNAVARGDYAQARRLFALTAGADGQPVVAELAEAFGLMLVKVEAREYHLEKVAADLDAVCKQQAQLQAGLARENKKLRANQFRNLKQERLASESPAMREIARQCERIAQVDATVLITGETGTGKGMLARSLHYEGARAKGPFVSVNCAAIPSPLLESELFGIEKGVASGVDARIGRFEQAGGGTIFLDEIGDMPLESQAKILHVIENRQVERVGGRRGIPVDVRVIAATHRDLAALCEQRLFRPDLYYRLNVIRLHVPALRERPEDIPALVRHFLSISGGRNPDAARGISKEALRLMAAYSWPGNIRELENETERAALLARGNAVTPQDLSPTLASLELAPAAGEAPVLPHPRENAARGAAPRRVPARETVLPSARSFGEMEADLVRRALAETRGNKTQAAKILGISREGLRKMLRRLNISA
jgi:DNA-binding NtrC family response regulator